MNRLQVIALVGAALLEACSASDDVPERPVDAGRDVKTTSRPDATNADRLDASGGDANDGSAPPPGPDDAMPDSTLPPPDVTSRPDGMPPPDVASPDGGPTLDSTVPPPPIDAPGFPDAPMDSAVPSCVVTFTVSAVSWSAPEGGADAQAGARVVRLVGDASNIGSWTPTAGVLLAETAPGTWSGTTTFRDQQITEFKFVKLEGVTPEWESWTPYDSNRSLRVECFGDAGILVDADANPGSDAFTAGDASTDRVDADAAAADGATDASTIDGAVGDTGSTEAGAVDANLDAQDAGGDARIVPVPARGKSYVGVFNVRPPDATK